MSAFPGSDHQPKVIALIPRQSDVEDDCDANNKIARMRVPVIELLVKHHYG
jgi:hypothetical protein